MRPVSAHRSMWLTRRSTKMLGFSGVHVRGRRSFALQVGSSLRPLHRGLCRGFTFGGHGAGGILSIVVMVERWRARRVYALSPTSSRNSKFDVSKTRRPFPIIALRSRPTISSTTHRCRLPASSPPVLASKSWVTLISLTAVFASLVTLLLTSVLQLPRAAPCKALRSRAIPPPFETTAAAPQHP
jgi:hypothetical protein